jgi:PKHD-type hydroxylase
MILELKDLLSGDELAQLRKLAGQIQFVDGRATNEGFSQKQNLQSDPRGGGGEQVAKIVWDAYNRSRQFRDAAFPKRMAPPTLGRYEPGMKYGPHADSAFLPLPSGMLRSDISSTLFLSEPAAYEGGELVVHAGAKSMAIKFAAGSAVLYPSTSLHEVRPVTSGERLVSLTFIESYIADERDRAALFELGEISAIEGDRMHWLSRMRLELVRQNLMRRWSAN